jgi:putative nucleotidyltransferase with HDIG domain
VDDAPLTESQEPQIPPALRSRLLEKIHELQMQPQTAALALQAVKNPHCTTQEFVSLVEKDVKLAAEMLKMANSVAYSPGVPVTTLHQAVVRLGFRRCQGLILTASVAGVMQHLPLDAAWNRDMLRRHSWLTAVVALHVNRELHVGFDGEEFVAGLIHDIGRLLLAITFPERFREIDPLTFAEETADLLAHERRLTETTHAEVGAWFAAHYQLPAEFSAAARYHHDPESAGEHLRLVALTAAADHMANYFQYHGSAEGYDPARNTSIDVLEASGVPGAKAIFLEQAISLLDAAAEDAKETRAR